MTIITENCVASGCRRDLVITGSTDDCIGSSGQIDEVTCPAVEFGAFDFQQRAIIAENHLSVVAHHDSTSRRS